MNTPMVIDSVTDAAQIVVAGYTTLEFENHLAEIKGRPASLNRAVVYWKYLESEWTIDFVHLEGTAILKSGKVGKLRLEESAHVEADGAGRPPYVPAEILEIALANPPEWEPEFTGVPDGVAPGDRKTWHTISETTT